MDEYDNDNESKQIRRKKKAVVETKKRPGRPRKTPIREKIPRSGIQKEPSKQTNAMELIYDDTESIKKIFAMFKALSADVLKITFDMHRVLISTTDHYNKSIIHAIINCKKMNRYYCRAPFIIMLNSKNVERIIRILDKTYITITLVSKIEEMNKILHIIYKNDMKIDEYREIDLIDGGVIEPDVDIDDANYQIKFTLPSRFFKKLVVDISSFSDVLTFEKAGIDGPLQYSYTNVEKTLKSKHVVKDPTKIMLECNMKKGDIFGTSIILDYIKALSSSLLSSTITISADTNKDMIFQSYINNDDIHIKVKTHTVNLK